ncbi:MAG: hypothetical protein IT258_01545 [Saprospiraceae bacterium]|nr:hypothetical protein [Saprospiraceae bacterium]
MANRPPIRATGFTRFFLVMILIAPLAYLGASYYNGEDGISNLKKLLRLDKSSEASAQTDKGESSTTEAKVVNTSEADAEIKRLKEELDFKTKRNEELYRENEELKRKLESAEKALEETKK